MKIIFLLLITNRCLASNTKSEVFAGSLTYHFFNFDNKASRFKNKQSSDGLLISNPMLGYLHHGPYDKDKVLSRGGVLMLDSIGSPALGLFQSNVKVYEDILEGGFFYGLYLINGDKWEEKDMVVPMSFKVIGSAWAVPMFGLRLTHKLKVTDSNHLRLNTLISPTLVTINVGFSWDND